MMTTEEARDKILALDETRTVMVQETATYYSYYGPRDPRRRQTEYRVTIFKPEPSSDVAWAKDDPSLESLARHACAWLLSGAPAGADGFVEATPEPVTAQE